MSTILGPYHGSSWSQSRRPSASLIQTSSRFAFNPRVKASPAVKRHEAQGVISSVYTTVLISIKACFGEAGAEFIEGTAKELCSDLTSDNDKVQR